MFKVLIVVGCLFSATHPVVFAGPAPFDRYQIILDRQPFMKEKLPEPAPGPVKAVAPAEVTFARSFRICMMVEPEGEPVVVGIVDERTGKNYLFHAGETVDDVTMIEADYEAGEAVFSSGGVMARVSLANHQNQKSPVAVASTISSVTPVSSALPSVNPGMPRDKKVDPNEADDVNSLRTAGSSTKKFDLRDRNSRTGRENSRRPESPSFRRSQADERIPGSHRRETPDERLVKPAPGNRYDIDS